MQHRLIRVAKQFGDVSFFKPIDLVAEFTIHFHLTFLLESLLHLLTTEGKQNIGDALQRTAAVKTKALGLQ